MRKLIILEAPDRLGKNTFLNYLKVEDPTEKFYHVFDKGDISPPTYRNIEEFNLWLRNYLTDEMQKLASIDNNIVIDRLFTSDFVYSNLFDRQSYILNVYDYLAKAGFEFVQLMFLYPNYDAYLGRCGDCGSEVEYSEKEFIELQSLYQRSIFNRSIRTCLDTNGEIDHLKYHSMIMKEIGALDV